MKEQTELFRLTQHSTTVLFESLAGLSEWGMKEPNPNLRQAIMEYYNQLVNLYKDYGDYHGRTSSDD